METRNGDRAAEDSFAKLFEAIADAALLVDIDTGRIVEANAAARRVLGYDRDDLLQLTASDLHPHEIPALDRFMAQVMSHGRWDGEGLSCRTKQGGFVPARVRATYVEVFGRRCILSVIHDLRTEQLAELGQAVRKVAHDLRNVLSNAVLLGERLSTSRDPKVKRLADGVLRSVERASEMCERTLSKGTAREPFPETAVFDITGLAREVAADLPSESVVCEVAAKEEIHARADRPQVHRILLNLAVNAAQAPGTSRIRFEPRQTVENAVIDVVDDGPGLPQDLRADLAHAARIVGTGLGLQIARELAANNAGQLDLIASNQTGTRFRLTLPADPHHEGKIRSGRIT